MLRKSLEYPHMVTTLVDEDSSWQTFLINAELQIYPEDLHDPGKRVVKAGFSRELLIVSSAPVQES